MRNALQIHITLQSCFLFPKQPQLLLITFWLSLSSAGLTLIKLIQSFSQPQGNANVNQNPSCVLCFTAHKAFASLQELCALDRARSPLRSIVQMRKRFKKISDLTKVTQVENESEGTEGQREALAAFGGMPSWHLKILLSASFCMVTVRTDHETIRSPSVEWKSSTPSTLVRMVAVVVSSEKQSVSMLSATCIWFSILPWLPSIPFVSRLAFILS